MSKILVIGEVLFETQLFIDSLPNFNEVAIASDADSFIGSKTINTARILEKLNDNVYFFARVGDDQFGEKAKEILEEIYNFSTDFISTIPHSKTGKVVVLTDKSGKSAISIYFGANKIIDGQDINSVKNSIEEFDFVYTGTNLPVESLYSLVDECKKHNVPIFVDVPNHQDLIDLKKLNNAAFVAPNRQEAGLLVNMEIKNLEDAKNVALKMREQYTRNIIITLDKDGCVLLEENSNEPLHFSTEIVNTIDETGSGDIFRAVFVSQFLRTKNIKESIKSALKIATRSVKIKGVDNTINNLDLSL